MSHTPGPWKLLYNGSLVQDIGQQLHLGTFSESAGLGTAAKDNAALIAAAPDLLQALELLLIMIDAPADDPDIVRARNAVTKAKGETP